MSRFNISEMSKAPKHSIAHISSAARERVAADTHSSAHVSASVRASSSVHSSAQTASASETAFSVGSKTLAAVLSALLVFALAMPPLAALAQRADAAAFVVGIDIGHGTDPSTGVYDPGACANGLEEATANTAIAQALANELRTYDGVSVVFSKQYGSSSGGSSIEKRVRSLKDQGANVIVSVHNNSAGSSAYGSEAWVPNTAAYLYKEAHETGKGLGSSILSELANIGQYNRGVKTRNCTDGEYYPAPGGLCDWYGINYWGRQYGICGIIIEHAFVTNPSEAAKLKDSKWTTAMGVADAAGIAKYYGLTKHVDVVNPGVTSNPDVDKTEKSGEVALDPSDIITIAEEDNSYIMGSPRVTAATMAAWYKTKRSTWKHDYTAYGASSIDQFCEILYQEAVDEGVRPEVVFCQAMKETGWLDFGGMVAWNKCNFCGLGAVDNSGGSSVADFGTYGKDGVRMGLRAQVQHLKAYACADATEATLAHPLVDPRFNLFTHGRAPQVLDLSGTWASDTTYGSGLQRLINELLKYSGGYGVAGIKPGDVTISVDMSSLPAEVKNNPTADVFLDGKQCNIDLAQNAQPSFTVEQSASHVLTVYEYKESGSEDRHTIYPTSMYGWILEPDTATGKYVATRYHALDDLLTYAGCSIRITGNKGVRMITSLYDNVKSKLTSSGVGGWKIVESGTLIAWADNAQDGELTMNTNGVVRGTAYKAGQKDPVFQNANGRNSYTNVLVLPDSADASVLGRDLAMRPYVVMQDSAGRQSVVYGGTLYRSISYIAGQNENTFAYGSDAYNFIHGILDACK